MKYYLYYYVLIEHYIVINNKDEFSFCLYYIINIWQFIRICHMRLPQLLNSNIWTTYKYTYKYISISITNDTPVTGTFIITIKNFIKLAFQ